MRCPHCGGSADQYARLKTCLCRLDIWPFSECEYHRAMRKEIERLRAALERIAALKWPQPKALKIAREALESSNE